MANKEFKLPIPTKREELRKVDVNNKDYKAAYAFANKVYKKFGPVVLSVVLFGSAAKGTAKKESDIDIFIIVDNVSMVWDQEIVAWYREELFNIVKADKNKDRLHLSTITLSNFWDNVRVGEPAVLNILRYGLALLDLGFFEPTKFLLYQGRIRPSAEAIYTTLSRTPWHILRARIKTLSAIEDLYWAMVDSAHAALMTYGHVPPSPEHVAGLLTKEFVKNKKLEQRYVKWYNEMYSLAHDIKNNKIKHIQGSYYDLQVKRTKAFSDKMTKLTQKGEKSFLDKRKV